MNFRFVCLAFLTQHTACVGPDARVIGGAPAKLDTFPFIANLMSCNETGGTLDCDAVCTGSIISPNMILTAGHCLEIPTGADRSLKPLTELERMRVLVGTRQVSTGGKLYKVKKFFNRGAWHNPQYPLDDDVGLVVLQDELELIPGSVEVVRMSPEITPCGSEMTLAGFGQSSNLERVFDFNSNAAGVLKSGEIRVLSHASCRELFTEFRKSHSFKVPPDEHTIDPDTYMCAASESTEACFRDSGAPAIIYDDGFPVVVGTVSFGAVPVLIGFCGGGPDFYQRISGHVGWIREILENNSITPARVSFTRWPFDSPVRSEEFKRSRCEAKGCDLNRSTETDLFTKLFAKRVKLTKFFEHDKIAKIETDPISCLVHKLEATGFVKNVRERDFLALRDSDVDIEPMSDVCQSLRMCDLASAIKGKLDLRSICENVEIYQKYRVAAGKFQHDVKSKYSDCSTIPVENIDSVNWFLVFLAVVLVVKLIFI